MKRIIIIIIIILCCSKAQSQLYFPPIGSPTWDTLSPSSLGWCLDSLNSVYSFLDQKSTKAFIVLKDGKIALEKYFGSFTKDSIWYWASAGKTLTAFSVGQAQEKGYLKITDTTTKYLGSGWTSLTTIQENAITVRHQLTMTTGLDDNYGNDNCTEPLCLNYKASPGTRWAYHNAPYTLLHDVINSATGNFTTFFNNQLRNRIGMNGLWLKGSGTDSFNRIYYSTPRSMARFGLLMLNKGIWSNDTLLGDTAYIRQMANTSQSLNLSYGYLTWLNGKASYMAPGLQIVYPSALVPNAPADMYAALGKNDQKLYVIPSYNMVIVRLGNDAGFPAAAVSAFDNELWGKLKNIFCVPSSNVNTISTHSAQIYPNPANDYLFVNTAISTNYTITIVNTLGQILNTIRTNEKASKIDIRNFNAGVYWLVINNDVTNTRLKFVKQ